MAAAVSIQGAELVPIPRCDTNLEGVLLGITRPYLKPWDISPHVAANEPAKPPLED